MKTITKRELIKSVAEKWRRQYPGTAGDKWDRRYHELKSLPDTATEQDIANIIGNWTWTSNTCDECEGEADTVAIIGNWEGGGDTVTVCIDCLRKAILLIESA